MSLASEYSPLIQAILANDEDALQAALDADPASANERDRLGHTPLYYVVVQDFSEALPALLAAGADPAAEPRRDQVYSMMPGVRSLQSGGGSLLHSCAEHRTPELCAALATELRARGVVSSCAADLPRTPIRRTHAAAITRRTPLPPPPHTMICPTRAP